MDILEEIGPKPDFVNLFPDKFGRYKIRKGEKLEKCLELFEPKTEKWWRLKEHIFGLDGENEDLNNLIANLDRYYPRVRENSTNFTDVIKTVKNLQENGLETNFKNISKNLNKGSTVTYEYLRKLERWGIFKTHNKKDKIWLINDTLPMVNRGG